MSRDKPAHDFSDEVKESLWRQALVCGMSRRRFLALLGMGGAAAALSSCAATATRTITNTTGATATVTNTTAATITTIVTATPPATTPPATTAAARILNEPRPAAFFYPVGLYQRRDAFRTHG